MSNRMVRNIYSQAAQDVQTVPGQHEDKSKEVSKDQQLPSDLHKDKDAYKDDNKDVRKGVDKDSSKDLNKDEQKDTQQEAPLGSLVKQMAYLPTTDEIDFALVKAKRLEKTRINCNVPLEWKQKLDLVAEHLDVAKYDMVAYLIGRFLGEIKP